MHVEADLHEARHDLLNLFLSRAFLHHHYHAATLQGELPCFRQVRGTRHVPGLLACLSGAKRCVTQSIALVTLLAGLKPCPTTLAGLQALPPLVHSTTTWRRCRGRGHCRPARRPPAGRAVPPTAVRGGGPRR